MTNRHTPTTDQARRDASTQRLPATVLTSCATVLAIILTIITAGTTSGCYQRVVSERGPHATSDVYEPNLENGNESIYDIEGDFRP